MQKYVILTINTYLFAKCTIFALIIDPDTGSMMMMGLSTNLWLSV